MRIFTLLVIFIFTQFSFAQDGQFDASFGSNGVVELEISNEQEEVYDFAISPAGTIYVLGKVGQNSDNPLNYITAIRDDGSVETDFSTDGLYTSASTNYRRIYVQETNRILLYESDGTMVSWNIDGSLDTSFGNQGTLTIVPTDEGLSDIQLLDDDSFYVFTIKDIQGQITVMQRKYSANGDLDTTFGNDGVKLFELDEAENFVFLRQIVLDNDRLITLHTNGDYENRERTITRFLSDGGLDSSFGNDGKVNIEDGPYNFCRLSVFYDGSILAGCNFYSNEDLTTIRTTRKYSPSGAFMDNFGDDGIVSNSAGALIQENQRFIGNSSYSDFEGGFVLGYQRFLPDGMVDDTFSFDPFYEELGTARLKLDRQGRMLFAVSTIWYNGTERALLLRYNNDPLSVPENEREQFKVFPNPSSGLYNIQRIPDTSNYSLFNLLGKKVKEGLFRQSEDILDISDLPQGIYVLRLGATAQRLLKF
ncbi:T9SS type A sorting domain-containing protein [Dokdonia sinensis]|nr:T9SS type A sorting domain-containing protein [Dokdonia sinensis]